MSRSVSQIYDAIVSEKEKFTSLDVLLPNPDSAQLLLSDLDSSSAVADWRLHYFVISSAIALHEDEFEAFKAALVLLSQARYGGLRWYADILKKFQYGDSLIWNGTNYDYDVIDESKQIITQAAAEDELINAGVTLKTAKDDGVGGLTKLSSDEHEAAIFYMQKVRPAGVPLVFNNQSGDLLKFTATIYIDPALVAADGTLLSDPTKRPAIDAIIEYLSYLEFNGLVNLTKLMDAVIAAQGIDDMTITTPLKKAEFDIPYSVMPQYYKPEAGYMIFEEGASVINYVNMTV